MLKGKSIVCEGPQQRGKPGILQGSVQTLGEGPEKGERSEKVVCCRDGNKFGGCICRRGGRMKV